jgi:N6-adenosine-specific RNA methylase IME4
MRSDVTRYRTIVADPPWAYPEGHIMTAATGRSKNVKRDGARAIPGRDIRRSLPYPSMTLADIAELPVRDLADDDARLFLWTTNRYLPDAFDVLKAWGFTYRQALVWHKSEGGPFPASVAVPTAEFLLVANLGQPERSATLPSAVVRVPAPRSHSTKPEAFLDLVEQVSPGPYLEMFARRNRLGWDTWGNEALEHVDIA